MNYGISVLFRTIPLLMALFCFGYGAFVLDMGTDPAKNVAGPVVMSLGMICIALFATAATIIRQIIHTYNTVVLYALPVLGYLAALLTFICGWEYISEAATASHFVEFFRFAYRLERTLLVSIGLCLSIRTHGFILPAIPGTGEFPLYPIWFPALGIGDNRVYTPFIYGQFKPLFNSRI